MTDIRIVTAVETDPEALHGFLCRFYPRRKADFLRGHGAWWHRGQENRWAVTVGGKIAAYCAVIPTSCMVRGRSQEAVWWVDLVVAPEHRGAGLQRMLDERVRACAPLILGFPNELAAKVHRRHGWGVREDLRVLLCPLRSQELPAVQGSRGLRGLGLRAGAAALAPASALLRWRARSVNTRHAWVEPDPDPELMAEVFRRHHQPAVIETERTAGWLRWRYLNAPHRDEFLFVMAGRARVASLALVVRLVERNGAIVGRILDLFGDVADPELRHDAMNVATRKALEAGAVQLTAMASEPELATRMRRSGFMLGNAARSCWWSSDSGLVGPLSSSTHRWTLGDSDNDE